MADEPNRSPRRRPVDVLFGEEMTLTPAAPEPEMQTTTPGYMVEPPRPVVSVRPPPPEFPNDWQAMAQPEPARVMEPPTELGPSTDPIAPPPPPPKATIPVIETIAEAVTFTTTAANGGRQPAEEKPAPVAMTPPAFVPPQMAATPPPAPAPLYGQAELLELSQFVDQLYQNVADETSDSAALNAECLANLNRARAEIEKGEYARAEAAAELVKARLLRARASRAAASAQTTRVLFGGLILAALVGVGLFAIPFAFRIVPLVIPLLRGVGLGMLGGAAMALFQLAQHIARREYDAAFNFKYALAPLLGALIGGVLYLLSILNVLAAPNALGITFEPFALMYLFALLGGFFNDVLLDAARKTIVWRTTGKQP